MTFSGIEEGEPDDGEILISMLWGKLFLRWLSP